LWERIEVRGITLNPAFSHHGRRSLFSKQTCESYAILLRRLYFLAVLLALCKTMKKGITASFQSA
jgi:hypothetical protein